MASRRKKPTSLTAAEIDRFMADVTKLHGMICAPNISPYCEHYRSLRRLNDAIHAAVEEITGRQPPWLFVMSSWGKAKE